MKALGYNLGEEGTAILRPCSIIRSALAPIPATGKMNKQTANGVRAKSWLTD
jgi:hypothetical protein